MDTREGAGTSVECGGPVIASGDDVWLGITAGEGSDAADISVIEATVTANNVCP